MRDYLSTNLETDRVLSIKHTYKLVIDKYRNGNYNLVNIETDEVVCEFQNNEGDEE